MANDKRICRVLAPRDCSEHTALRQDGRHVLEAVDNGVDAAIEQGDLELLSPE